MSGHDADFSGDIPRHYDSGMGPILFAGYAADMARLVAAGGTPSRVLEVAAGSGIVSRALRDALPAGAHLTSTDLNPAMLDVAREKFRPDEAVSFQSADATSLPFADAAFDTLVCQFGVMFYPDKDKGHREAHRVLAAGGRYLFSVWDAHRHNPFGQVMQDVVARFFPRDPPRFYEVPFSYHLIDPIKESLLATGFGEIRVSVVRQHRRVADLASFARGAVFGNPIVDQIRQRGGASPSEVEAAVIAALRRAIGSEPALLPTQAILFETRKG